MYNLVQFDEITKPSKYSQKQFADSDFKNYVGPKKIEAISRAHIPSEVKSALITIIKKRIETPAFYFDPSHWYMFEVAKVFKHFYPEQNSNLDFSINAMATDSQRNWENIKKIKGAILEADSNTREILKAELRSPFVGTCCERKYHDAPIMTMNYSTPIYDICFKGNYYKRATKGHKTGDKKYEKTIIGWRPLTFSEASKVYKEMMQVSAGTHQDRRVFYLDVDVDWSDAQASRIKRKCAELGIPEPVVSVHNDTDHFDCFWELDTFFDWHLSYTRSIVHNLYLNAFQALKHAFIPEADKKCTGFNCRNPYSNTTHFGTEKRFSFACMESLTATWFEATKERRETFRNTTFNVQPRILPARAAQRDNPLAEIEVDSRHMWLLDKSRRAAFKNLYYGTSTLDKLTSEMFEVAHGDEIKRATGKEEPLEYSEVKSICESSFAFANENFVREKYDEAKAKYRNKKADAYSDKARDASRIYRSAKSFVKTYNIIKTHLSFPMLSVTELAKELDVSKSAVSWALKPFSKGEVSLEVGQAYDINMSERLEAAILLMYKHHIMSLLMEEGYIYEYFNRNELTILYCDVVQALEDICNSDILSEIFGITRGIAASNHGSLQNISYMNNKDNAKTLAYSLYTCGVDTYSWLVSPLNTKDRNYHDRVKRLTDAFEMQRQNIKDYYTALRAA